MHSCFKNGRFRIAPTELMAIENICTFPLGFKGRRRVFWKWQPWFISRVVGPVPVSEWFWWFLMVMWVKKA